MNSVKAIMNILEKHQHSQVLITANELGIFRILESGIQTPERIAKRLNISERGLTRLVETLKEMGLIEVLQKRGSDTKLRATRRALQCFGKKGLIRNWTAHQSTLYKIWSDLPKSIKNGRPILKNTHDLDVQAYAIGLMESYLLSPKKLHEVIDLSGNIKMLDIGGGAGHYTILAALSNHQLRGTIFDRHEIVKITKQMIRNHNLEERVSVLEGNVMKSNWSKGYDVILLSNILHGKSISEAKQLLLKAFRSLNPKGRVIINEWIKGSHLDASLFNLTMLLCTKDGQVLERNQLSSLVREVGFTRLRYKKLGNTNWVIEAWKQGK